MTDLATPGSVDADERPPMPLQFLRTRLFDAAILIWSLPFGLAILTLFKVVRSPALIRRALRLWSFGFISAARWIVGVRYRFEGLKHVPARPVIFVSNHQSYWESIAFTAFVPDINVVSKAEAMKIPVFGWGLRHAPMTPVFRTCRGANLRRIVREGQECVAQGRSILIFPEGTRVGPGCVRPHQRGLEQLYRACSVPVVPVAHNAGLCWTKGFQIKHRGEIVVRFFPPVFPGGDPSVVAGGIELLLNREKEELHRRSMQHGSEPRDLAPHHTT